MNQSNPKQPLRWYRWLTQFSLRSLLILVTLSAVVCWWLLRPESQEEKLADDLLVLRRQVRTIKETPAADQAPATEKGAYFRTIDDGTWELLDEHRGLIASGICKDDVREGRWTIYHPNGQKAAEGELLHGARHGLWRVWDAAGHPVSEVTYQAPISFTPSRRPEPASGCTSLVPVVGATALTDGSILPQFGGSFSGGSFSGGFCGTGMMMSQSYAIDRLEREQFRSLRHGRCRAWHPVTSARSASEGHDPQARSASEGPSLAFEGQYDRDQRSGLWTFYDEQGRVVEQGNFVADCREGEWTAIDWTKPDARRRTVRTTYIRGRTQAEHDRVLAGIAADLASGSLRRQLAGITWAEELGKHGWPLLTPVLDGDDVDLKLLALRTFVRQAAFPAESLATIESLADHSDKRLSVRAKTAIYLAVPERRGELFHMLLAEIDPEHSSGMFGETIVAMFRCDEARRTELVRAVVTRVAAQTATSANAMPAGGLGSGFVVWHLYSHQFPADLGNDIIPHLDAVFAEGDLHERLLVMQILQRVVESGPIERPFVANKTWIPRHVIPNAAQPLLQRAKADPEPEVRQAAEAVGTWSNYYGGGGWGISGGGFGGGGGGANCFGGQSGGFF